MKKIYLLILFGVGVSSFIYAQQILVSPYLQPGDAPTLTSEGKVIIWQTDSIPGDFKVEYTTNDFNQSSTVSDADIFSTTIHLRNETSIIYRAPLRGLKFDQEYSYRVTLGGSVIAERKFDSRTKKSETHFVVFGDCGIGSSDQDLIANQVYQQQPQFVLIPGDIVYSRGLERDYRNRFFPYYNSGINSESKGVRLMSSIPFYGVVGNHDVGGSNLDKYPDGLAYFYYYDLPLNGPATDFTISVEGNSDRVSEFKKNSSPRFPNMSNYSFDFGNVHIVCLDSNPYVNPFDETLLGWIRNDLKNSKSDWKIVTYHHPGFNSSDAHYNNQQMRLLAPLFEELNVDMVFSGHVHNYQRSVPLKFEPTLTPDKMKEFISKDGKVDGKFTLDTQFDGTVNTKPMGVIYIVSGAGGAELYDKEFTNNPEKWKHMPSENWMPFTTKMISDRHSFSVINTTKGKLTLKQLDEKGIVIDEIEISK